MKSSYDKKQLIIFFSFIVFILTLLVIISIYNMNIKTYTVVSGIVSKENIIVMLSQKDYNKLTTTQIIYVDNQKYKFNIKEIIEKIIKKDNIYYHQLVLEVKLNNYNDTDVLEIVIPNQKELISTMIKNSLKGDK